MARTVVITPDQIVIRLSGWTALAALRRELRIPRAAVRSVSTAPWTRDGLRIAGTGIPFRDYRQGRFRRDGRRLFLSFERRDSVVVLEVDRRAVGYDTVVVGVDNPLGVAGELERG